MGPGTPTARPGKRRGDPSPPSLHSCFVRQVTSRMERPVVVLGNRGVLASPVRRRSNDAGDPGDHL